MSKELIGSAQSAQDVDRGIDDSARLPVVGVVNVTRFKNNPAMENVEFQLAADIPQGQHDVCRIEDAQARLAEKDARIAQLAAHARGKNKALENALKVIEQLRRKNDRQSEYIKRYQDEGHGSFLELDILRAKVIELEKLQSAPAERGGVVLPELKVVEQAWGYDEGGNYAEGFAEGWNDYADEFARLNPAPATADSDVREVK